VKGARNPCDGFKIVPEGIPIVFIPHLEHLVAFHVQHEQRGGQAPGDAGLHGAWEEGGGTRS